MYGNALKRVGGLMAACTIALFGISGCSSESEKPDSDGMDNYQSSKSGSGSDSKKPDFEGMDEYEIAQWWEDRLLNAGYPTPPDGLTECAANEYLTTCTITFYDENQCENFFWLRTDKKTGDWLFYVEFTEDNSSPTETLINPSFSELMELNPEIIINMCGKQADDE